MAVPDEASVDPRPAMKKSAWTKQEDAVLEEQVRLHGPRNWEGISAALPGRNAKSCRLRWCQHLAPEVDAVRPFTPREDATIVALQKVHPNKWATIAGYLPGRTDNAIKNRWNSVLRKQQQKQQHKDRRTLALFRLVPGDIRTAPSVDYTAAIDHEMPAAEGGGGDDGACLNLFPLVPGDIVRGVASGAAPMNVDCGADDPLTQLRLFTSPPKEKEKQPMAPKAQYPSTAEAAFRAMVQAVRAR